MGRNSPNTSSMILRRVLRTASSQTEASRARRAADSSTMHDARRSVSTTYSLRMTGPSVLEVFSKTDRLGIQPSTTRRQASWGLRFLANRLMCSLLVRHGRGCRQRRQLCHSALRQRLHQCGRDTARRTPGRIPRARLLQRAPQVPFRLRQ